MRWIFRYSFLYLARGIFDDECEASDCALQALQRRGRKKWTDAVGADDLQAEFNCYDGSSSQYYLNWEANGTSFFQDWTFVTEDPTNGDVNYLGRQEAFAEGIVEAFEDHVILKIGKLQNGKRDSVRIHSDRAWDPDESFLVAMKYRHVPYGAGVWPAFWTMSSDNVWPKGGELDITEFANDQPNLITLHTQGTCSMSDERLKVCTPPTYTWYDKISTSCDTDYHHQREGCRPPQKRYIGELFNMYPGTFVAEWNNQTIKVWHFHAGQEPPDLALNEPRPVTWDPEKLLTWFPLDQQSCRGSFSPQELVLNIEICGDYAGNTFEFTPLSYATGYRTAFGSCGGGVDCCRKWIQDPRSSGFLNDYAVWDIDFIKVFTPHGVADHAQKSGTFRREGKLLKLEEQSAESA